MSGGRYFYRVSAVDQVRKRKPHEFRRSRRGSVRTRKKFRKKFRNEPQTESKRKDPMAARPQLPGMRWFLWLRNTALRIGVLTGIYLSCTFHRLAAGGQSRRRGWSLLPGLRNLDCRCDHDFSGGNSGLALPARTRENVCFRPDRMDTFDVHLSRGGNALHAARKPHGSAATVHSRRGLPTALSPCSSWVFLLCAEARHRHIAQTQQASASGSRARTH